MEENINTNGAFLESLKRNNKQIRDDRAEAILETTQMNYRRKLEDLELTLKNLRREQSNSLDLAPDSVGSLKPASSFDEKAFVENDIKLVADIHNTEILFNKASARFEYLFGKLK